MIYRQAQPYRKGARQPGQTLGAMLAGRPRFLPNPQDTLRATARGRRLDRAGCAVGRV